MSEEEPATTPKLSKIWYYKEMNDLPIPEIEFEPASTFYADVVNYCEAANIAVHPSLKQPAEIEQSEINIDKSKSPPEVSPKKVEEPTYLQIFSKKIDRNTIQALTVILPYSQIDTLKLCNNDLSYENYNMLIDGIKDSPITNLFIDWNPIKSEKKEEIADFSKILDSPKLKNIYLRSDSIDDDMVEKISSKLKTSTIIGLDLSKNNITKKSIAHLTNALEINRTLQYIGLAMNNLSNEDIEPFITVLGAISFSAENVEAQLKKMKERDAIIEKNKKQKGKKEEPVPVVDNIVEQDGAWVIPKNQVLKHLNLIMNNFTDAASGSIEKLMAKTKVDFVLSIISKGFSKDCIKTLSSKYSNKLVVE